MLLSPALFVPELPLGDLLPEDPLSEDPSSKDPWLEEMGWEREPVMRQAVLSEKVRGKDPKSWDVVLRVPAPPGHHAGGNPAVFAYRSSAERGGSRVPSNPRFSCVCSRFI